MRKVIIALAQIKYFDVSKTNNLKKILKYIRLAKKKNADIICFPESCIKKSALDLDDDFIKIIAEECKKNEIWCIVTDDIRKRGKPYNMALLINRKGKIKGEYKKIHLYGDNTYPGKESLVFKTDFGKIGIAICWDLAFPELFREMKQMGAEIVFCPSQWWYDAKTHSEEHQDRELEILKSLVLTRAYENVCFICLCNPIVDSKFQISYSAIASPTKILQELKEKEGLLVQEINLDEIDKIEKIYNS